MAGSPVVPVAKAAGVGTRYLILVGSSLFAGCGTGRARAGKDDRCRVRRETVPAVLSSVSNRVTGWGSPVGEAVRGARWIRDGLWPGLLQPVR